MTVLATPEEKTNVRSAESFETPTQSAANQIEAAGSTEEGGPYSVLSSSMIIYLTYLLGYLALASSLTATIYFPLISLLAKKYDTTVQKINLTITLYIVFQGIGPSLFAPLSDTLGRRPILMATFTIYLLASIGLVLAENYAGLLLLRALQSIGGGAVLSLAYAVVSDVVPHAERGSVLGPMMAATNLGPCLGSLIGGGAILASNDPTWCFVALVAFGSSALMLVGWTMPETGRAVVGNGSVKPLGIWATWWTGIRALRRTGVSRRDSVKSNRPAPVAANGIMTTAASNSRAEFPMRKELGRGIWSWPNPWPSFRTIFYPDTALILWLCTAPYAVWYCIQTSIPLVYGHDGYGFNDLQVGLCFLAGGVGVIAGGFVAGRLMDWNFRRVARKAHMPVDKNAIDISQFPIEHARSDGSIYIMLISIGAVSGYGWAIRQRTHPSVPLIIQFYIGMKCTVLHQIYSALIVDIFPTRTGTAAASNNICRCALSALAIAFLQPAVEAMGYAWLFVGLAVIEGVGSILAVSALRKWGRQWRSRRDEKPEKR